MNDTYIYRVENHNLNSCQQMDELWRQRELCDVNLLAENADGKLVVSVPAHRLVLAANIPYFKAMLTSKMQESDQRDITLMNIDGDGLKRIVGFAYTGKLEITETSAQGILVTASLLALPEIVSACERFIGKHLGAANCLGIAEFARLHHLEALASTAEQYSSKHFSSVAINDEFLYLSVDRVEELVRNDDITIKAEEEVYEAVTRWLYHDLESRKEHAERLYHHVRFPILSSNFLKKVAQNNNLLTSLPAGKIMLQDAHDYHDNPASALYLKPKNIQPRSSVAGVLCVAGGTGDSGLSLSDVSYYTAHAKSWKPGTKMQVRRNRLAMAVYNSELYAIGGVDLMEPIPTVEKYSPLTNSWRCVASLNIARRSCTAVATNMGIFVMGGFSGSVFLKSVEFYDAKLDEWQYQQPMLHSRSDLTSVYFDQRIYAIGGQNSTGLHRSVERFDFVNRKWESIADMCTTRSNAGLCFAKLLCGGICCVLWMGRSGMPGIHVYVCIYILTPPALAYITVLVYLQLKVNHLVLMVLIILISLTLLKQFMYLLQLCI